MPIESRRRFLKESREHDVLLSIHAPYYISLGSPIEATIENSMNELRKSVELAREIGSERIVFHLGSAKSGREQALRTAIDALHRFEDEHDLGKVRLYPELAGKRGQLGSLEDIAKVRKSVKCVRLCLDFGHLHAFTLGTMRRREDFEIAFDDIEKAAGVDALSDLHVHMYPIDWRSSGEVGHRAFHDIDRDSPATDERGRFLPRYEPLLEALLLRKLPAVIICEAKDSQDVGAREMASYFRALGG